MPRISHGELVQMQVAGENRCVCCGEIIPEGRQVCPRCDGSAVDPGFTNGLLAELQLLRMKIREGKLVEVVRCRHCIHGEELINGWYLCYIKGGYCFKPDFFCSDGKRREDNDS